MSVCECVGVCKGMRQGWGDPPHPSYMVKLRLVHVKWYFLSSESLKAAIGGFICFDCCCLFVCFGVFCLFIWLLLGAGYFCFGFYETQSHSVAQASIEVRVLPGYPWTCHISSISKLLTLEMSVNRSSSFVYSAEACKNNWLIQWI